VRGLRMGKDTIGFDMKKDGKAVTFEFTATGAPKDLTFTYAGETRSIRLQNNTKITID
jgi:hypothetical protein